MIKWLRADGGYNLVTCMIVFAMVWLVVGVIWGE